MKHIRRFKEHGDVTIRNMVKSDIKILLDLKYQYFGKFYKSRKDHDEYAKSLLDLDVSIVAEMDGNIVGGYFLSKTKLPKYIGNFYNFDGDLNGIEGVSIFVHPDVKGMGVGRILMDYYKTNDIGIDFIYGKAFHGLNNLDIWLKRRELFNDIHGVYYTIEFYNGININKYKSNEYKGYYDFYGQSLVDFVHNELSEYEINVDVNNIEPYTIEFVDILEPMASDVPMEYLKQCVEYYLINLITER